MAGALWIAGDTCIRSISPPLSVEDAALQAQKPTTNAAYREIRIAALSWKV